MKLEKGFSWKGVAMPTNYLSYSWAIALTLVLASCASTPEEERLDRVRAQNRLVFGEDADGEIDLLELARQVVFLERERQRLIAENSRLRAELNAREQAARRYDLLPVQIAYFESTAVEGDELRFIPLDCPNLPTFIFGLLGPRTNQDFDHNGFFYEDILIYLPRGRYRVEVCNRDVLRFTLPRAFNPATIRPCVPLQIADGRTIEVHPTTPTVFLFQKR